MSLPDSRNSKAAVGPDLSGDFPARIRAGDQSVIEQLFISLYAPLLTYLVNQFRDYDAAEDAIQAVFVDIWNNRTAFYPTVGIRAYCFAAARNRMLMWRRSSDRLSRREHVVSVAGPVPATPEEELADRELRQAIEEAMADLPERAREVFYLVRNEGLSYSEAANALGISVNTVKTQLARAGTALKSALGSILSLLLITSG